MSGYATTACFTRRMAGLLAVVALLPGCREPSVPSTEGSLAAVLGRQGEAGDAPYAAVERGTVLTFPRDHGPHPQHRIEWWYLTAVLRDDQQRRWGAQLALFRLALQSDTGPDSGWDSRQLYLAHAAISDLDGDAFHYRERYARPVAGAAGSSVEPLVVWVDACRFEGAPAPAGKTRRRIDCRIDGLELAFDLATDQPPVLHGEAGYSEKSGAGNASHYYSFPFLAASGWLRPPGGEAVAIEGSAWFDHEWSSALLDAGQRGWDWFSLRLDDGSALMLFRLHHGAGNGEAVRGSLIGADGRVTTLAPGTATLSALRHWRSPHSGAYYPLDWRIAIPAHGITLESRAQRDDQELNTTIRYWEGRIDAAGTRDGQPLRAEGYLELTGYAPR
jgi:predicted secreted hydrolase